MIRSGRSLAMALAVACAVIALTPATASAGVCSVVGWFNGVAGKACTVVGSGHKLINAGKKLATGHPGGALKTVLGGGRGASGVGSKASTALALGAIVTWAVVGARFALHETATVIGKTSTPQLTTTWFSGTYWRIAGIAALLTMPFLFAAAVQALIRSDLSLLARAALGYLPLSLLAVSVAAPVTMLLLAASDQMSAIVSSAAGDAGTRFLSQVGIVFGTLSLIARAPFLVFLAALMTAAAAIALWVEMLMREAAVYIVVLMLPLAFAAMVWPARRIWAIRSVELLVALILSKFAIVAVLALGGAALGQTGSGGAGGMLTGLVLVLLAAFAPWALLRLLPLAELASTAAGHLSGELRGVEKVQSAAGEAADRGSNWAGSVVSGMRRDAAATEAGPVADEATPREGRTDPAPADSAHADRAPADSAHADRAPADLAHADTGHAGSAPASGAPAGEGQAETVPREGEELATVGAPAGTASTASPPAAGSGAERPPTRRSPGMDRIWQAGDGEWRTIVIGDEDGWSPAQFGAEHLEGSDPPGADPRRAADPSPPDHGRRPPDEDSGR